MTIPRKRRVAMLVVVLLAFAQANVAFSYCSMDRGTINPIMESGDDESSAACEEQAANTMHNVNLCAVHCTWDLQVTGAAVALVRSPSELPILAVVLPQAAPAPRTGLWVPPAGAPPHRILLHSFLI